MRIIALFAPSIFALLGGAAATVGIARHEIVTQDRAECLQQTIKATKTSATKQQIGILRSHVTLAEVNVHYWERQLRPYALRPTAPADILDSLESARTDLAIATKQYQLALIHHREDSAVRVR